MINEYRKKILKAYEEVFQGMNQFLENSSEVEIKEKVDASFVSLEMELLSLKKVFDENKELRTGNLLNARIELDFLVGNEKGIMKKIRSRMNECKENPSLLAELQADFVMLQNHQSILLKFLESECANEKM